MEEVALDNLFEMPPYSLSQLQRMGCGAFKGKLEKGSSGERREHKRSQTDRVHARSKQTQNPDPQAKANWRGALTRAKVMKSRILASSKAAGSGGGGALQDVLGGGLLRENRQRRLANFVAASGRVIERLLAEGRHRNFEHLLRGEADHRSWDEKTYDDDDIGEGGASAGGLRRLYNLDLCRDLGFGRRVKAVCFSDDRPPLLAVALGPRDDRDGPERESREPSAYDRSSVLGVYDLESAGRPAYACACSGEVSSCVFGPSGSGLVLAGTEEGGVCLWDLGEPDSNHGRFEVERGKKDAAAASPGNYFAALAEPEAAETIAVRWPSYTTEGQASLDLRHSAQEVVSLFRVGGGPEAAAAEDEIEASEAQGARFRVLSVNRCGVSTAWDVCDVPFAQSLAQVTGTDLGLRIGSRYKLVKSGACDVEKLVEGVRGEGSEPVVITAAASAGDDVTTMALGTGEGVAYKCNRFGTRPRPPLYFSPLAHAQESNSKLLRRQEGLVSSPVTGAAFSPSDPRLLLCCHLDGSVCLYRTTQSFPIQTWNWSRPLRLVRWHPNGKTFYALDASSNLVTFDPAGGSGSSEPLACRAMVAGEEAVGGVQAASFELSALRESHKEDTFACCALSNGKAAVFVLAGTT